MPIMASNQRSSVAIQPINYADIHACAEITSAAFAVDPHTTVKNLGQEPYDMYEIIHSMMLNGLPRRRQICVKAVDEETGEILGHAGWAFRGVDEVAIPWTGPADDESAAVKRDPVKEEIAKADGENDGSSDEMIKGKDSIDRLKALEDRDMEYWQTNIIPKDKQCMIITGLHVHVSHQCRGIGSALLRYGNAIADELGIAIWVHSSHQAYQAYKKAGFEAVRELPLDLDEWAPRGPMEDEVVMGEKGSGKWGRYIIRYMKRDPKN